MFKHKILFLAIGATLAFSSCRKTDAAYETTQENAAHATETTSASWTPVGDWKSSQQEQFKVQFGTIQDPAITADVVNKGLVLVYAKEGANIQSLPYQSEQSNSFWYYQIAEGSLLVSADVYGTSNAAAPEIRYFIFTEQQLNELEKSGTSKAEIMSLSYEQASAASGK
jgi:hypothetical protein